VIKVCATNPREVDHYPSQIERLLADEDAITFGGGIAAYWSVCQNNAELQPPVTCPLDEHDRMCPV